MEPLIADRRPEKLHDYIAKLEDQFEISARDARLLRAVGATTPEAVQSIVESYPQMLENLAKVDYALGVELASGRSTPAMSILKESMDQPLRQSARTFGDGATVPEDALWPEDSVYTIDQALQDLPPTAGFVPAAEIPLGKAIPYAIGAWPVKNQGERSTCVSFAVGALVERRNAVNVSEQFLHWALKIKTSDPNKDIEGTNIIYALQATCSEGTCDSEVCPYNPHPIPGSPSQDGTPHAPSPSAIDAASTRLCGAWFHDFTHLRGSGKAAILKAALEHASAVAISLPVFQALDANITNWSFRVTEEFGRVLDPLPNSKVVGAHAVCVVGFTPDPSEPEGGYFVIRNSWGNGWGAALPAAGYSAPEPGFGDVSARFVDQFMYEYGYYRRQP
jgi:hypothetical protein